MLRQVNINVANNTPMRTPIGMNAGRKETFTNEQHKVPTIDFDSSGKKEKFVVKDQQPQSKPFPTINNNKGLKEKFGKEQRKKVYPTDPDLRYTYTGWAKRGEIDLVKKQNYVIYYCNNSHFIK